MSLACSGLRRTPSAREMSSSATPSMQSIATEASCDPAATVSGSWHNSERTCWSLGYMTPRAYYEALMAGDVERRDTFRDRVLDPTSKFVREKLAAVEEAAESNGGIGSSDPALFDRHVHDAA